MTGKPALFGPCEIASCPHPGKSPRPVQDGSVSVLRCPVKGPGATGQASKRGVLSGYSKTSRVKHHGSIEGRDNLRGGAQSLDWAYLSGSFVHPP